MDDASAQREMDRLKKTYDDISPDFSSSRQHQWPEFSSLARTVKTGAKVLDLGCGNGRFFSAIEERQVDYTGLDFSASLLDHAKKQFPKLDFVEGNLIDLPFESGTFDVVVSVAAFHHLPSAEMRKKAFDEAFRVLKDDGVFLFTVWNLWQWKYLALFLTSLTRAMASQGRYEWSDLEIPFGPKKKPRYYHAFTSWELKMFLKKAGFIVDRFFRRTGNGHNYVVVSRKRVAKTVQQPIEDIQANFNKGLSPQPQSLSKGA